MTERICMLSQRNLGKLVSRCGAYEFEDVICEVDDVQLITQKLYYPCETYDMYRFGKRSSNWLARNTIFKRVNPGIRKVRIAKNYELFLAFFQFPHDISTINAVLDWRKRCRLAVCWVDDAWVGEINRYRETFKLLSEFDLILVNYSQSVNLLESTIGRCCIYMTPGVDMVRFCPFPKTPKRIIDVYSLGRRSPRQHEELLRLSEDGDIFYVYDTILRMETNAPREHRNLIANMAKRAKYFIVNPAKMDVQSETQGQTEVGFRFFEGSGAGAVMIGEAPSSENFRNCFDWKDAVVHVSDGKEILRTIRDLDADTVRTAKVRKTGVVQSLLRHDWVYRWKDILKIVGMDESPKLSERENRLKELAHLAENY